MATRIILNSTGTADVMQLAPLQPQLPGPGEVWLEQTAMGVNPLDVLQRKGGAPLALPCGLGLEGAGQVTALGEGVHNVQVGDRVAYAMGPLGGYA
ncbi:MAG: alcohol dehydrogenase catalytic domain-containing protein, partial [Pseudomonas sp.]